jgi:arylsulfatase A
LEIEKKTIIIWTSDNGDEDSYYKRTKTFDGNGPFRGVKRSLYEGGIRAPLLAYWPGTIKPNSTSHLQTTQWDLMPTLADAGGQPITKDMDGISILPTLSGKPGKQAQREYLYFEFYEKAKQQSVRMGDWKAYRKGGWNGNLELYDLAKDIGETTNIAGKHPDIVQRMKEIMKKEHSPHPVWNLETNTKKKSKK